MEFQQALRAVEQSEAFTAWRSSHSSAFLSHAFVMLESETDRVWQFGFFDDSSSKVTTFVLAPEGVRVMPEEEIIGKGMAVAPIAADAVTASVNAVLEAANAARHAHYPQESRIKTFFIVQMSAGKAVFSVTFLTQSFKTINVKIAADTCDVMEHSMAALMDFA